MQLGQISVVREVLANHALKNDKLWQKNCNEITESDICLFYARAGIGNRVVASRLIQAIQNALIGSAFNELNAPLSQALLLHEVPAEPFYADELVDGLTELSSQEGLATVFSLETRVEPYVVARLTWKELTSIRQPNQIAEEIIEKARHRKHPRLPYVFWQKVSPTLYAPIFDLPQKIQTAFGMNWVKLLYAYENMMPVCRKSEAEYFNSIIRT